MNASSLPANSVSSIESYLLGTFTPQFTVTTSQSLSNANVLSLIRVPDSASQANRTSISRKIMAYGTGYSSFLGVKTATFTQEINASLSKHLRSKSISQTSNSDEKSSFSTLTKALLASEKGTPTYTFASDLSMTSEVGAIVSTYRTFSIEATTFSTRYAYPEGRSTEELTPLNFNTTTRERKSITLQNEGNLSTTALIKTEERTVITTTTLGHFVASLIDIRKTITLSNAYNISMRISLNQDGFFPTAIREKTSMVNRKSAEPSTSPNRFVSSRYSARRTTESEYLFYISAAIKASTPSVLQNTLTISVLTPEAIKRKNETSITSLLEKASNLVSTSMKRRSDSTNSPSKIMGSQVASETQEQLTSNVDNSRSAQFYSTTPWSDKTTPTESTLTKRSTFTVSSSKPQPVSSKITMTEKINVSNQATKSMLSDHKVAVASTKISALSASQVVTSQSSEPSERSSGFSFISPSSMMLSSTLHSQFTEPLVVVTSYIQSTPTKGNYPYMTKGKRSLQSKHSMIMTKTSGQSDSSKICLLYTSPSPRDLSTSRMPSSA